MIKFSTLGIFKGFMEYSTKDSKWHFPFSKISFTAGDILAKKMVKHANYGNDDIIYSMQFYVNYTVQRLSCPIHFSAETNETWQTNRSTGRTVVIKLCYHGNSLTFHN